MIHGLTHGAEEWVCLLKHGSQVPTHLSEGQKHVQGWTTAGLEFQLQLSGSIDGLPGVQKRAHVCWLLKGTTSATGRPGWVFEQGCSKNPVTHSAEAWLLKNRLATTP